jgi:hypothetical protein
MLILLVFASIAGAQVTGKPLTLRERMDESLKKQRESVRKQAGFAKEDQPPEPGKTKDWFTLPWPTDWEVAPVKPLDPPESPTPTATRTSAWEPDCDPVKSTFLEQEIEKAARRERLPSDRLREVVRRESGFYPCAVSPKGAQGLMQLMPDTARELGVKDPFDPVESLAGGAKYLRQLLDRYSGDWVRALGAYNAGPGAVDAAKGLPPFAETENYVRDILGPP